MTRDRQRSLSPARLCEADLAAARSLEPSYDLARGALRLSASLAVVGAAGGVASASAASAITKGGVTHGLAAKMIALLALSGAVLTSDVPGPVAPAAEAPAVVAVAVAGGERVIELAPRAIADAPGPRVEPSATAVQAQARPAPQASARKRAPNPFGRELADVAHARALLSADPNAALAAAESPAGSHALAEEREIIAIRALVSLGRTAEAKARAREFASRRPGSPFAATARSIGD